MAFDESDGEEYRDSFEREEQRPVRCCDRCGDGDDASKPDPMCGEIQLAFGLVTWICHDCRKDWHRMFKTHKLQRKYSEASLRLEFWKARVGEKTPESEVNNGIELLLKVDDLELEINDVANAWLVSDLDEVRSL